MHVLRPKILARLKLKHTTPVFTNNNSRESFRVGIWSNLRHNLFSNQIVTFLFHQVARQKMFFNVLTFSCWKMIFGILIVSPLGMARHCGFNPGGAVVRRKDNSTYPYFGMPCVQDTDCGDCDLDATCTCQDGCCAPTGGVFGNYTCLNQVKLFYDSLAENGLMFSPSICFYPPMYALLGVLCTVRHVHV